jgi:tetratricopeptide (TPR) repeat protein
MAKIQLVSSAALLLLTAGFSLSQTTTPPYTPGEFQSANPNYPIPNPFYFEGKVDWDKLKIDQPANTWEYMQRGIHKQDDLEDIPGAIEDYKTSLSMNSLDNGTCQIVTAATLVNGALPRRLDPAPCMFTVRLRLAYLLREEEPEEAIALFREVLEIDPLRLEVNALIGEVYVGEAEHATTDQDREAAYENAIKAFKAELDLSPVTAQTIALTGDEANNAHVHWELAEIYEHLGRSSDELSELDLYLKATKWHSDVYPWRIDVAKKKIEEIQAQEGTAK